MPVPRPDTLLPTPPFPAPYSPVQEQQAHPHHHPEPARPRDWRGRGLHRLHPPYPVHRWAGPASHQPVRGDQGLAPPGWQVAQCPLSLFRGPCRTAAVSSATGAPGGGLGSGWDKWGQRRKKRLRGGIGGGYMGHPRRVVKAGQCGGCNKSCSEVRQTWVWLLDSKLGDLGQVTSPP